MVDQLALRTIGVVIAASSVVVGVLNSILMSRKEDRRRELALNNQEISLKNQEITLETRQAQLFMQLYAQFITKDFQRVWTEIRFWEWEGYDEFVEKYGPQTNPEAYSLMLTVGNFFDGVGMLVSRGLIDMSFVEEMFSNHIVVFWDKLAPIIEEARARQLAPPVPPRPRIWAMVEYLYDEVIKYEEQLELET